MNDSLDGWGAPARGGDHNRRAPSPAGAVGRHTGTGSALPCWVTRTPVPLERSTVFRDPLPILVVIRTKRCPTFVRNARNIVERIRYPIISSFATIHVIFFGPPQNVVLAFAPNLGARTCVCVVRDYG